MKRLLFLMTALMAAVAATSGCASVAQQQSSESEEFDARYVAAVERAARQFGTQIVWINYPRKRTTSQ